MKLTHREIGLLEGMIEVQENHIERCGRIQNRSMADKQVGWDQERIDLLNRILNYE